MEKDTQVLFRTFIIGNISAMSGFFSPNAEVTKKRVYVITEVRWKTVRVVQVVVALNCTRVSFTLSQYHHTISHVGLKVELVLHDAQLVEGSSLSTECVLDVEGCSLSASC